MDGLKVPDVEVHRNFVLQYLGDLIEELSGIHTRVEVIVEEKDACAVLSITDHDGFFFLRLGLFLCDVSSRFVVCCDKGSKPCENDRQVCVKMNLL